MRLFPLFIATLSLPACGRVGFRDTGGALSTDAGPPDSNGSGRTGAGGAGSADAGASACPSMSLNQAPLACTSDYAHAEIQYPLPCDDPAAKGYLARCGSYDAIIAPGADPAWCFYSRLTGNLAGAVSERNGTTACISFDLDFTRPDVTGCVPVVAGNCPP